MNPEDSIVWSYGTTMNHSEVNKMMLLCLMYVTDHYIQTKTQAHRAKSDLLQKNK